jgi:endoglucanase
MLLKRKKQKKKTLIRSSLAVIGVAALTMTFHVAEAAKATTSAHLSATLITSVASTKQAIQSTGSSTAKNGAASAGSKTSTTTAQTAQVGAAAASKQTTAKTTQATTTASTSQNPIIPIPTGYPNVLFANPNGETATDATAWAQTNPSDAYAMERLASTPVAQWYVGQDSNVEAAVASYVSAASGVGQLPVLVAYNIPERDCGGDSAGGASNASTYTTWMAQFAAGIGQRPAIVIVEPDALAAMDCLDSTDQQTRVGLIAAAVHTLKSETNALVYIDAGNPDWQTAAVMAGRLESADISEADGFSLNVSNFYTTSSNSSYGTQLSQLLGGKHFVIDTSRNGNGPTSDNQWCNPAGRAFGDQPTMQTGTSLIDAYLWIKVPGESDGACGPDEDGTSAPAAGVWWPQYTLSLLNDSGW